MPDNDQYENIRAEHAKMKRMFNMVSEEATLQYYGKLFWMVVSLVLAILLVLK